MPVKIELAIREGWKFNENNRFGEALEVRFIDIETRKIMFRYAPKCEDRIFWEDTFGLLDQYDIKLKELRQLINDIDGRGHILQGTVVKNDTPGV